MSRAAYPLAWRRVAAWAVDWLSISAHAAALVPVVLSLLDSSVRRPRWGGTPCRSFAGDSVAGRMGRRPLNATPGKRLLGLQVRVAPEGDVGWRRAPVRNALKVTVPWELGHTAAFLLADPKASGSTVLVGMTCAVLACALAAGYVASLFIGTGRTFYDHAAATHMVRSPAVERSGATR